MRDEVPISPAGHLRPQSDLSQWSIAAHVTKSQSHNARENLEDTAGIPSSVVFTNDDWLVLGEGRDPAFENFEFGPFDVQLDQRRNIVAREGTVERLDVDVEPLNVGGIVASNVEPASCVRAKHSRKRPPASRASHCCLSDIDPWKLYSKSCRKVGKRLEGDVASGRRISSHVSQEIAYIRTNVDAVSIGGKPHRKQETKRLVVAQRAPYLAGADCPLHEPQLPFKVGKLCYTQYSSTESGHQKGTIVGEAIC